MLWWLFKHLDNFLEISLRRQSDPLLHQRFSPFISRNDGWETAKLFRYIRILFLFSAPMLWLFRHLDNFWTLQSFTFWFLLGKMKSCFCHYIIQGSFRPMLVTWGLIPHCHVPMPPTDVEDAITMALTMRAKSPMNIYMHKIAKTECWNNVLN